MSLTLLLVLFKKSIVVCLVGNILISRSLNGLNQWIESGTAFSLSEPELLVNRPDLIVLIIS